MTTSTRSKAHFAKKLAEFGLQDHWATFEKTGFYAIARFANAGGATPDKVEQKELVKVTEDPLIKLEGDRAKENKVGQSSIPEALRLDVRNLSA